MQKTVLNEVFELLQQIGAVSSESEFSKDWRYAEASVTCVRYVLSVLNQAWVHWLYVQANYSTMDAV